MSNESIGSISPIADAAPVAEEVNTASVEEGSAESSEEIEDDGSDLSIDGVEAEVKAIDEAVKSGDISKKAAESMKKKLKLKVNGVEEEVEFDMGDEAALIRELQKSRAFDKTAKEHAGFKAQVDQLMSMLMDENQRESVLERLGIDVDKLAETRLSRKIDEMKKSPEQVKQEKLEQELEQLRKEKKEIEDAKKRAEEDKLRNEAASQIEADITEALESKNSFLPKKSPWVLRTVGQFMFLAAQKGYPQVTAKDVMPLVEKEYREQMSELFDNAPEERLEEIVGKKNLDRYRKAMMSKRKTTPVPNKPKIQDTGSKATPKQEEEPKKYRMKDLFGYRK